MGGSLVHRNSEPNLIRSNSTGTPKFRISQPGKPAMPKFNVKPARREPPQAVVLPPPPKTPTMTVMLGPEDEGEDYTDMPSFL